MFRPRCSMIECIHWFGTSFGFDCPWYIPGHGWQSAASKSEGSCADGNDVICVTGDESGTDGIAVDISDDDGLAFLTDDNDNDDFANEVDGCMHKVGASAFSDKSSGTCICNNLFDEHVHTHTYFKENEAREWTDGYIDSYQNYILGLWKCGTFQHLLHWYYWCAPLDRLVFLLFTNSLWNIRCFYLRKISCRSQIAYPQFDRPQTS